jgi:hypothetical protein
LASLDFGAETLAAGVPRVEITRTEAAARRELFRGARAQAAFDGMDEAIKAANDSRSEKVVLVDRSVRTMFDGIDRVKAIAALAVDPGMVNALTMALQRAATIGGWAVRGVRVAPLLGTLPQLVAFGKLLSADREVDRLMQLTESELRRLTQLDRRLKTDVDALRATRVELADVQRILGGSCDSTKLVKREPVEKERRTPPEQEPPKSPSAGKIIGIAALVGGAAAGTMVLVDKVLDAIPEPTQLPPTTTQPTGSAGPSSFVSTSGITCVAQGGGSFGSNCTGTIVLNIGNSVPSGSQLIIVTDPSQFMAARTATTTGAPGTMTFSIQQSRTNVDFSGNITCYPVQNRVLVFRDSTNGSPLATLTATVPVTCRR